MSLLLVPQITKICWYWTGIVGVIWNCNRGRFLTHLEISESEYEGATSALLFAFEHQLQFFLFLMAKQQRLLARYRSQHGRQLTHCWQVRQTTQVRTTAAPIQIPRLHSETVHIYIIHSELLKLSLTLVYNPTKCTKGLVCLIGEMVCLLAANRGSNCSLTWAMDGRIVRCGIISSCQSSVTCLPGDCKVLLVASQSHYM